MVHTAINKSRARGKSSGMSSSTWLIVVTVVLSVCSGGGLGDRGQVYRGERPRGSRDVRVRKGEQAAGGHPYSWCSLGCTSAQPAGRERMNTVVSTELSVVYTLSVLGPILVLEKEELLRARRELILPALRRDVARWL